jgi:predicted ribonuclease YlaK
MARSISKKTVTRATGKDIAKPQRRIRIDDLASLTPLTQNQRAAISAYKNNKNLMLHGMAGTGKTYIGLSLAFEEVLDPSNDYEKVVIIRSTVSTRDIGFLKGDDKEKIAVYEAPYSSLCMELFGIADAYESLKTQGAVQFMSTSFVRGITLNNCVIIIDEFENLSFHELDTVITRMGKNSKIVFCGDYTQSDLTKTNERNGCLDFMRILKAMNRFEFIEFGIEDIVRGETVRDYIIAKYKLGLHI